MKEGSILDALEHAKEKYPNDLEMQERYMLLCINQLKKNYPEVKTMQTQWRHYSVILTMFPSEGKVWFFWELYSGAMQDGIGLESLNADKNICSLHFSSNTQIKNPIIPELLQN